MLVLLLSVAALVLAGCGSSSTPGSSGHRKSTSTTGVTRGSSPAGTGGTAASTASTPASGTATSTSTLPAGSRPGCTVDASKGAATLPPWPVPTDALSRIKAACLIPLGAEGSALHIHMWLVVYVDGKRQTVPALIGIDVKSQQLSALHTHDTSGIVHLESPTVSSYTLGEFFTEWDVALSADQLGDLKTQAGRKTLRWWVNGKGQTGDPAKLVFAAHQIIVLAYGAPDQHVDVPTSYPWNGL